MILHIYTIIHVIISLVGIFTGLVVLFGLLVGKRLDGWTKWFLITTVATSVTGFFFPFHGFTPAIGVGIISLLVLAVAVYARHPRQLAWHCRGNQVPPRADPYDLNLKDTEDKERISPRGKFGSSVTCFPFSWSHGTAAVINPSMP